MFKRILEAWYRLALLTQTIRGNFLWLTVYLNRSRANVKLALMQKLNQHFASLLDAHFTYFTDAYEARSIGCVVIMFLLVEIAILILSIASSDLSSIEVSRMSAWCSIAWVRVLRAIMFLRRPSSGSFRIAPYRHRGACFTKSRSSSLKTSKFRAFLY